MTWKEFKMYIDQQIKKMDIPEHTEIDYIDISAPCSKHEMYRPECYYDKRTKTISIH